MSSELTDKYVAAMERLRERWPPREAPTLPIEEHLQLLHQQRERMVTWVRFLTVVAHDHMSDAEKVQAVKRHTVRACQDLGLKWEDIAGDDEPEAVTGPAEAGDAVERPTK